MFSGLIGDAGLQILPMTARLPPCTAGHLWLKVAFMEPEGIVPWRYFAKSQIPPWVRSRKPIGWIEVAPLDWSAQIESHLGRSYARTFLAEVFSCVAWLRADDPYDGDWRLWKLSNGSIYLAPIFEGKWHLERANRTFRQTLTGDATGLCATELAMNWYLNKIGIQWMGDSYVKRNARRLQSFREQHPEGSAIRGVLD